MDGAICHSSSCKRFQQTQNIGIEPIKKGDRKAEDEAFIPHYLL
jgi:hypothetical protein